MTHSRYPANGPTPPRPSVARQVASWIWALMPAWSLGFATAPLMIVAIKRIRHWLHIMLSVVYVAMVVLLFANSDATDGTTGDVVFGAALAVNMLVGTGHALFIRSAYFRPMSRPAPQPTLAPGIAQQQAVLEGHRQAEQMRAAAHEVAASDPARAVELRIGRIDLPQRAFPDGGLIDANNVPPDAFARELPGLAAYANALATGQRFGFTSAEEMSVTLGLPPRLLEPVADRLIFLPRYEGTATDA